MKRFASELHYLAMFPTQNKVCRMRSRYCVLTVLGDLLDGGELHFLDAVETLEDARQRIASLAEVNPGQYVIYNKQTGERVSITAGSASW